MDSLSRREGSRWAGGVWEYCSCDVREVHWERSEHLLPWRETIKGSSHDHNCTEPTGNRDSRGSEVFCRRSVPRPTHAVLTSPPSALTSDASKCSQMKRKIMKRKEVVVFGLVDLTPYYLYEEDVKEFHQTYRLLCNRYDPSLTHSSTTNDLYGALYEKMKAQCDDYFYIPRRQEHRGVGGLFFDDLHSFPSYLSPVTPSKPSNKDDEMFLAT